MFSEDSIESIHALTNTYSRTYAALEPERRAEKIFQVLHARKATALKHLKLEAAAMEKKRKREERGDGERPQKKPVRQGKRETVIPPDGKTRKVPEVIAREAERFVRTQLQPPEDAPDDDANPPRITFKPESVKLCTDCRDFNGVDYLLPVELFDMHHEMCHRIIGDKFGYDPKKNPKAT